MSKPSVLWCRNSRATERRPFPFAAKAQKSGISGTFISFARSRAAPIRRVRETPMPITHVDVLTIQPLVALLFGILILIMPRLLNYLIGIYLVLIGAMGLWPHIFTTTV
jgi:Protein of unknown function (DUF3096)